MKAIVLLSGGLDSAVVLALALKNQRDCLAISFNYGQRHVVELEYAKELVEHYHVAHRMIHIDPSVFGKAALVSDCKLSKNRTSLEISEQGIPSTYVPARNTLFLSYALTQAELFDAQEIHIGPNAMDANPYPDCRPQFIQAFQALINVATRQSVEGSPPRLIAPLVNWDKQEIVRQGKILGVPFEKTFSCYDPKDKIPCQQCDACVLRKNALRGGLESPIW